MATFKNAQGEDVQVEDSSIKAAGYYSEDEITVLKNNNQTELDKVQKAKYEEGKTAGFEMSLKDTKKTFGEKYGIDTDGLKDYNSLLTKTMESELAKVKQGLTGEASEIEGRYKTQLVERDESIVALQNSIKENEGIYAQNVAKKDEVIKTIYADMEINSFLANTQRDVPDLIKKQGEEATNKFLNLENEKAKILLKNLIKIDYTEDGKAFAVDLKTGDVLKDKLQNPEKLSVILADISKQYNLIPQSNKNKKGTLNGDKINTGLNNINTVEELKDANNNSI